jgi:hypothetical protein
LCPRSLPVPHVASDQSVAKPHLHGAGPRRQAASAAAESSPFPALLDDTSEATPQPRPQSHPQDPPDKSQANATTRTSRTTRDEPLRDKSGKPPAQDAERAGDCADSQAQAAPEGTKSPFENTDFGRFPRIVS